jgi:hypothetical protein
MRFKTTPARPRIKPSSEWAREAPVGATALIVAECTTKGRLIRRIAMDWLFGERNKAAPLRTAAAKMQDTAPLSTSGIENEHHESDGGLSLSSSERCQIRWTIRSVPAEILQCWAGFEDGMCVSTTAKPLPAQPASLAETQSEAKRMTGSKAWRSASAPAPSPVETAPVRSKPTRHAAPPILAPLSALILNMKEGFAGNCAVPGGDFVTDGRSMLLFSACDDAFLSKMKSAKCGTYGPDNPVSTASARKLFDTAVRDAKYGAEIAGYLLGHCLNAAYEPNQPFACIVGPGERIIVANAHRILLIQTVTGANNVKVSVDPNSLRLTFFKDEQPVALLLAMDESGVNDAFRNLLRPGTNALNITSLSSASGRGVAV